MHQLFNKITLGETGVQRGYGMNKKNIRMVVAVAAAVSFGVLAVTYPTAVISGIGDGLETCAGVVVPSLFPFMVVSSFVAGVPGSYKITKLVSPLMRYVFRLPAAAFPALLFGLVGGYPVGCSVAAELYERGRIGCEHAQRLTLFCVNAGPAFTVTAVGAVMLGNVRLGAVLFASVCAASLIAAVLLGFMAPVPPKESVADEENEPVSAVFVGSVERSAHAMLGICAWVTAFSCLFSLLGAIGLDDRAIAAVRCVCEVTGGCSFAAQNGNIYAVAATLGWSGLSVICQVMGFVHKIGTPMKLFLAFRAVSAALTAVICRTILYFFPVESSVYLSLDGGVGVEFFSASAPAAVTLMCLCAVFVIDLDRTKKLC